MALTAFTALWLSGCASSAQPDLSTAYAHATLISLAHRHHVCAVAIALIKDRKLDSIGSASGCLPGTRVQADSVFQAASLSKPVFAYAVLKLVAQGKMALDVPVMTYLPTGYRHRFDPMKAAPSELVSDPRLQAITVRMVLNHTSGLPNWAGGPLRFASAPGAEWHYSGEGYVLLQRAVEAVTGQPLDRFMRAQVFRPLAMNHSSYIWNEVLATKLLPGTKVNGKSRATSNLIQPIAAFSLYTTAEDYAKFLAAVLSDTDVLQQVVASPFAVDPRFDLSWGLGWGIEGGQEGPTIWQWGNNPGYRAFVIASVRSGDGFVMLTNSENGLALAEPMAQKVLKREHKLFRSSMLDGGPFNWLCNALHVCF